MQGDEELGQLVVRAGVFEIKPLRKLAIGLVDRIGDFMRIKLGDDIERGHRAF
jgi:hypothetical protein